MGAEIVVSAVMLRSKRFDNLIPAIGCVWSIAIAGDLGVEMAHRSFLPS